MLRSSPRRSPRDPFDAVEALGDEIANPNIADPSEIFGWGRENAQGWDITDPLAVEEVETARAPFAQSTWTAGPMIAGPVEGAGTNMVENPARTGEVVGQGYPIFAWGYRNRPNRGRGGLPDPGRRCNVDKRAACVRRVADLYEAHAPEFFALAAREAGKTLLDGVGEVREAVDFARYYANEAERLAAQGVPRGVSCLHLAVEFPAGDFLRPDLRRAGGGQRGHRQARRADPADRRPERWR